MIHFTVDVRMRYEDMMGGLAAVLSSVMTVLGEDANYISCFRLNPLSLSQSLSTRYWNGECCADDDKLLSKCEQQCRLYLCVSFTVITNNNCQVQDDNKLRH